MIQSSELGFTNRSAQDLVCALMDIIICIMIMIGHLHCQGVAIDHDCKQSSLSVHQYMIANGVHVNIDFDINVAIVARIHCVKEAFCSSRALRNSIIQAVAPMPCMPLYAVASHD